MLLCLPHYHELLWLVHRHRELQMMKKGAFIVNYARADVIQKQVSGLSALDGIHSVTLPV